MTTGIGEIYMLTKTTKEIWDAVRESKVDNTAAALFEIKGIPKGSDTRGQEFYSVI